jgi:pre-mRNA-splicing factor ATP-dependent RNA helicase DHX16
MATDGQLREWVSDKLMSLLGYSKNVVVQYVIRLGTLRSSSSFLFMLLDSVPLLFGLFLLWDHVRAFPAKECSSTGDLVSKLVEFGFTSSAETRTFASDVYAKVPRRASGISVRFNFLHTLFFPSHFVMVPVRG